MTAGEPPITVGPVPGASPSASAPAPRTGRNPTAPDTVDIARELARRHADLLAEAVAPSLGLSRRMRAATRWRFRSPTSAPPGGGGLWGDHPPR